MKPWPWLASVTVALQVSCASVGTDYRVLAECNDSLANGSYSLVLPDGTVQLEGSFAEGRRHGVFTVYRSSGEKVAELPYANDQISGIVRLWYGPEYGAGERKLTSNYRDGQPHGDTEGWYPDGSLRERSTYENGVLMEVEFYDERGQPVPSSTARQYARSAREADRAYFSVIDEVVHENLPVCPSR